MGLVLSSKPLVVPFSSFSDMVEYILKHGYSILTEGAVS
jgi:hypothetical protein